jgi:hypothetical protein
LLTWGEARGKQDLYTRQSPQVLRTLRENTIIESALSSNRIEGVKIDPARVGTVVLGTAAPPDRTEEEVRGYRYALSLLHARAAELPFSPGGTRSRPEGDSRSDADKMRRHKAEGAPTWLEART